MKISEAIAILNRRAKPGTSFYVEIRAWKFSHIADAEIGFTVYLSNAPSPFVSHKCLSDAVDSALRWLDARDGIDSASALAEADAMAAEADEQSVAGSEPLEIPAGSVRVAFAPGSEGKKLFDAMMDESQQP